MGTLVRFSRIRERSERAARPRSPKPSYAGGSRHRSYGSYVWLLCVVFLVCAYFYPARIPVEASHANMSFTMCNGRGSKNCVIDGDTIRFKGREVRIANLDAPEIFNPKCSAERALGIQAKQELLYQLNRGSFQLVRVGADDEDIYGRKLRILVRDGRSLSDELFSKGLARQWSGKQPSWCD